MLVSRTDRFVEEFFSELFVDFVFFFSDFTSFMAAGCLLVSGLESSLSLLGGGLGF